MSFKKEFEAAVQILAFKKVVNVYNKTNKVEDPKKVQPVDDEDEEEVDGIQPSPSLFFSSSSGQNYTMQLEFFHEDFQNILQKCGDRPLAIISFVTGMTSQCDKSDQEKNCLILNSAVRYLQALEMGNNGTLVWDWMDSKTVEAVSDSHSGVWGEQTGIFVWPRPFYIRGSNCRQVSVILVHARGPCTKDDEDISALTWKRQTILNLSLLLSSTIVINLEREIQDESLALFENCSKFGNLLLKQDCTKSSTLTKIGFWPKPSKVIPRLHFLFNNVQKMSLVGPKLLKERLDPICNNLSFSSLPTFENSNLNPKFISQVEDFLVSLINSNDLPIKEIHDTPLSAQDISIFYSKYVQIFNKYRSPSPSLLAETIKNMANRSTVEKCLKIHHSEVNVYLLHRRFFNEKDLQKIFDQAHDLSTKAFNNSIIVGSTLDADVCRGDLSSKIIKYVKEVRRQNQANRNGKLQQAQGYITEKLNKEIEVKREVFTQQDCFDQAKLEEWTQSTKQEVLKEFFEILGHNKLRKSSKPDSDLSQELLEISSFIEKRLNDLVQENKEAEKSSRDYFKKQVDDLLNSHKNFGKPKIHNKYVDAKQLIEFHEKGVKECLRNFEELNQGFFCYSEHLNILEQGLTDLLDEWKKLIKFENHNRRQNIQDKIDKSVEKHRKRLLEANLVDVTGLELLHKELLPEAEAAVRQTISDNLNSDQTFTTKETKALGQHFLAKFSTNMSVTMKEVLSSLKDRMTRLLENLDTRSKPFFTDYRDSMMEFWNRNRTCKTSRLKVHHNNALKDTKWLMEEALTKYVKSLKFEGKRPPELNAKILEIRQQLIDHAEQVLAPLIRENDQYHVKTAHDEHYWKPWSEAVQTMDDNANFNTKDEKIRAAAHLYLIKHRDDGPVPDQVTRPLNKMMDSSVKTIKDNLEASLRIKLVKKLRAFGLRKFIDTHGHSLYSGTINTNQLASHFYLDPNVVNDIMAPTNDYARNQKMYGIIWSFDNEQNDPQYLYELFHDALAKTGNGHVVKFIRDKLNESWGQRAAGQLFNAVFGTTNESSGVNRSQGDCAPPDPRPKNSGTEKNGNIKEAENSENY